MSIKARREISVKRPDKEVNYRSAVLRRDVLLGTAASLLTAGRASTQVESYSTQPEVGTNILPAAPIPATPSLGKGKARALVLGGGVAGIGAAGRILVPTSGCV